VHHRTDQTGIRRTLVVGIRHVPICRGAAEHEDSGIACPVAICVRKVGARVGELIGIAVAVVVGAKAVAGLGRARPDAHVAVVAVAIDARVPVWHRAALHRISSPVAVAVSVGVEGVGNGYVVRVAIAVVVGAHCGARLVASRMHGRRCVVAVTALERVPGRDGCGAEKDLCGTEAITICVNVEPNRLGERRLERARVIRIRHEPLRRLARKDARGGVPSAVAVLVGVHRHLNVLVDIPIAVVVCAVAHFVGARKRQRVAIVAVERVAGVALRWRDCAHETDRITSVSVTIGIDRVLDRLGELRLQRTSVDVIERAVRVAVAPDPQDHRAGLERERIARVQVAADRKLHHLPCLKVKID